MSYKGRTIFTPDGIKELAPKPKNSRTILDTRFMFVTIPKRKVFGTEETEIERWKVKISSPRRPWWTA